MGFNDDFERVQADAETLVVVIDVGDVEGFENIDQLFGREPGSIVTKLNGRIFIVHGCNNFEYATSFGEFHSIVKNDGKRFVEKLQVSENGDVFVSVNFQLDVFLLNGW